MKIEYKIVDGPNRDLGWGTNSSREIPQPVIGYVQHAHIAIPEIHDEVVVSEGALAGRYVVVGEHNRIHVNLTEDSYESVLIIQISPSFKQ